MALAEADATTKAIIAGRMTAVTKIIPKTKTTAVNMTAAETDAAAGKVAGMAAG